MVPPDSHQVSRDWCYSGYRRITSISLYRAVTFCGVLSRTFKKGILVVMRSYNPADNHLPTVWASPISIASTLGITFDFLFLRVLRCVTSSRSLNAPLWIQRAKTQINSGPGCPIRRSRDQLVCSSPWLIAAYHVLHRLLAPRHPPYTLSNLTALFQFPDFSISKFRSKVAITAASRTVQVNELTFLYLHPTLSLFAHRSCFPSRCFATGQQNNRSMPRFFPQI